MAEHFELPDAEVIRENDKSILVEAPDLDEPTWVPKSEKVILDDSEVWDGSLDGCGPGTLVVAMWFAEERGWV